MTWMQAHVFKNQRSRQRRFRTSIVRPSLETILIVESFKLGSWVSTHLFDHPVTKSERMLDARTIVSTIAIGIGSDHDSLIKDVQLW